MARVLITNFHPKGGGGHVPYIRALAQDGTLGPHQIAVATPASSRLFERLSADRFPRLYECDFPAKLQKEPRAIARSLRRFRRVVADFRPDIVHVNGVDIFQALWAFPFRPPYRIVRTHHAVRRMPRDPCHRWLYARAVSANVFVSAEARRLTLGNQTLANARVIENGVDLEHFQPRPKDPQLAASLGIDPNSLCVGSCAGTGAYKRVDLMIEAARRLGPGRPVTFIILGEPRTGAALAAKAREAGVERFIYAGFHPDVRPYVALFDAGFILSDAIETISYAAREMMAMGKPLLSSSFSGLKENVRDGIDGWLVEPGDVRGIVTALERLRGMSPDALAGFSRNARLAAETRFDVGLQRSQHAALYSELARS